MKQTTLTTQTFIKRLSLLLMLLLGGWGLTPTAQAQAVEYLVPCSVDRNLHLLEKILAANTNPGLVTLILAEGCTYTLLGPYNGVNNGLPIITDDLIIEGNGATIERSGTTTREFRLVEIGPGVEVTLKNMTLKNGYAPDYNNGGAIYADGSTKLTIDDVRFIENKAFSGGAIYTKGTITVRRSKFDQNQASSGNGGGLFALDSVTVTHSEFGYNKAGTYGGGIFANQNAIVTSSILYLNQAISGNGGGLYVGRTLDLRQSIFSGNTAGSEGGGLWLRVASGTTGKIINNLWSRNSSVRGYAMYLGPGKGRVDVQHNTVVGTVDGGHLGTGIYINGPGVTVENSIFTGYNSALYKSSGDTATSRFNLFYGNQTNNYNIDIVEIVFIGDPLFGDEYHLTGLSPAIDRGTNVGLNVDLSGAPRPCGAGYDIGAYEFQFECHAPTPDPSPGRPFTLYLPLVVK